MRAARMRRRSASSAWSRCGSSRRTDSPMASAARRTSSRAEVQPEGAHLPQQVLDRAVGDRLAAGRVAHQLEVAPELGGVAVGELVVGLLAADQQPLGDVVELGPHRLVAAPLAEPAVTSGISDASRRRLASSAARPAPISSALCEEREASRSTRSISSRIATRRCRSTVVVNVAGGDAGVPVHVAARPAREAHGREVERLAAEAALELAHQLRHGVEQHAVEEVQVAAHLVVDLRALAPDLGGLPPQGERLADAVDHPRRGRRRRAGRRRAARAGR